MTSMYVAMGITVFMVCLLVIAVTMTRPSAAAQRMLEVVEGGRVSHRVSGPKKLMESRLLQVAQGLRSRSGISVSSKLKNRLLMAGFRDPSAADLFVAAQILCPLAAIFAASFIPSNTLFWVFALAVVGFLAPDIWLTEKTRSRKETILRSLPDALDLLVICVDAGLGLDQALIRVGEELSLSHPEIHEEFVRVNLEQRAGTPRLEAWQGIVTRTKIPELASFVSMLTQADRFGTPILKTLSRFADDLRVKRKQKVEEAAAKTKIKIVFPLVFCIFPCLFIVLLAPALLSISATLRATGK